MQEHRFSFDVPATPEEIWDIIWKQNRRGVATDHVKIEVLHQGDATGNGFVRHCHFPVPKYLLSRGKAQSWEWITEAKRPLSWRYDAIGKPLWSKAMGLTSLTEIEGGYTRVSFLETYHVNNRVMRVLLEKRVHRAISKDNDRLMEGWIQGAIKAKRKKESAQQATSLDE